MNLPGITKDEFERRELTKRLIRQFRTHLILASVASLVFGFMIGVVVMEQIYGL